MNFADILNLFYYRADLNLGATIRDLQSKNLLQMLAEPNLIVLEGKTASFLAGGQFPFPTITSTTTGGATAPVITVQFKNFGVQLDFTPTITTAGAIQLKVSPEVSSLDFTNAVQLQGFQIPALTTRRAETEVVLNDGESFAIAGLIDNRVTQATEQGPRLGRHPDSRAAVPQQFDAEDQQRTAGGGDAAISCMPLPPGEKPKLPPSAGAILAAPFSRKERRWTPRRKRRRKGRKSPSL